MKNLQTALLLAVAIILGFTACVKKDFDAPPYGADADPNLPVNSSIWELKQNYFYSNSDKGSVINDDITISGIVVANDISGNFYKQIIIQDSSSAISVSINQSALNGDFPVGRKVYVKCKGLAVGDYNQFLQLGYGLDDFGGTDGIPSIMVKDFIVKAQFPVKVEPLKLSIADLKNYPANKKMLGMLVELSDVEFLGSEVDTFWAEDPDVGSGTDRNLQNCLGDKVVVRTSAYANFRANRIPEGNGIVKGIYSVYSSTSRTTVQLLVRGLEDVDLTGERCGANNALTTVSALRSLYQGAATTAPLGTKIRVFVTSDVNKGNVSDRNLFVEDATGGIALRLGFGNSNKSFLMGDELEINVSGQEISEYNGLLQLNNVDIGRCTEVSSLNTLNPRVATVAEILANHDAWESTFVKIENASVTGGSTFGGNLTITDATGSIDMYTSFSAAFANDPVPSGNVDIKAIVSEFNNPQLVIRRSSDVN